MNCNKNASFIEGDCNKNVSTGERDACPDIDTWTNDLLKQPQHQHRVEKGWLVIENLEQFGYIVDMSTVVHFKLVHLSVSPTPHLPSEKDPIGNYETWWIWQNT